MREKKAEGSGHNQGLDGDKFAAVLKFLNLPPFDNENFVGTNAVAEVTETVALECDEIDFTQ
jgi:hypothetical protein